MEYTKVYYYKNYDKGQLDIYRTLKSHLGVELRLKRDRLVDKYLTKKP